MYTLFMRSYKISSIIFVIDIPYAACKHLFDEIVDFTCQVIIIIF